MIAGKQGSSKIWQTYSIFVSAPLTRRASQSSKWEGAPRQAFRRARLACSSRLLRQRLRTQREGRGIIRWQNEQCGASDGRICKEGAKSSGEHPMAGCKEGVLLLNHLQHAGTQSRGAGLHHTRAAVAEHCFGQERRSTRRAQVLARRQGFWSRGFGPSSPSSLRRNVPHFGQPAIDAYHLGHVFGSC